MTGIFCDASISEGSKFPRNFHKKIFPKKTKLLSDRKITSQIFSEFGKHLVGGWTNPFWKICASQIGSFWNQVWNHHLDTSFFYVEYKQHIWNMQVLKSQVILDADICFMASQPAPPNVPPQK